ncbi:MAG: SH3 domain-containing protein [Spirochaetia bacterium]|nr:SH3 domain-containing protein [Spirochaetia bacterium]
MRRTLTILLIVTAVLGFGMSCSKAGGEAVKGPANAPVVQPGGTDAYVMLHGLNLWTRDLNKEPVDGREQLKWIGTMTIADRVTIIGDVDAYTTDGKNSVDYMPIEVPAGVKVPKDGDGAYISPAYTLVADQLAVVKDEKCVLYNDPKPVGATKTVVPRGTIVAIVDGDITPEGFVQISYSLPKQNPVYDKWVMRSNLMLGTTDVQAAVVLHVVGSLAEGDKDRKINILEGAIDAYRASGLIDDLNNALLALQGGAAPMDLVSEAGTMTVTKDLVRVRSAPDTSADNVIGELNTGDLVEVVERSAKTVTVGSDTAHWYHIISPVDGWVFGAFLE